MTFFQNLMVGRKTDIRKQTHAREGQKGCAEHRDRPTRREPEVLHGISRLEVAMDMG